MEIYNGDCLQVMPTSLEPNSIDAIIADLPYGTTKCKWDSIIPLELLWNEYKRLLKDNGVVILFSGQPFTTTLISSNIKMFKYCWYWEKEKGTGFLNAKKQPLRVIEEICVFSNAQGVYNPQMTLLDKPYRHTLPINQSDTVSNGIKSIDDRKPEREYVTYTHAFPKNVLKFTRDKANKSLVPTQKPLALIEYLIETYTNANDTVLDNVMGSGTTGVACQKLNRFFIGIEKNTTHFEIAKSRIKETQCTQAI